MILYLVLKPILNLIEFKHTHLFLLVVHLKFYESICYIGEVYRLQCLATIVFTKY